MAVGGEGGAPLGLMENTHTLCMQKPSFTKVWITFQTGGWVQAPKELTVSVLEDLSRENSTSGLPTRRPEVLNAPRRIYRLPPLPPTPSTLLPLFTKMEFKKQIARSYLVGWLAGWLLGWLSGWLTGWLGWLLNDFH